MKTGQEISEDILSENGLYDIYQKTQYTEYYTIEEITNSIKKHIKEDGKIKAIDLYLELFKGETQWMDKN